MAQDFDDFAQKHSDLERARNRIPQEARAEWSVLKGLAQRFALDKQDFNGNTFEWVLFHGAPPEFLRLKDVAAGFFHYGELNGVPQDCRIRFSRRPLGPNEIWSDEYSPLDPVEWTLETTIAAGEFVWLIPQLGEALSSADLAEKVAIELSKYHLLYERHYGR